MKLTLAPHTLSGYSVSHQSRHNLNLIEETPRRSLPQTNERHCADHVPLGRIPLRSAEQQIELIVSRVLVTFNRKKKSKLVTYSEIVHEDCKKGRYSVYAAFQNL
jgi:hypothetical protein